MVTNNNDAKRPYRYVLIFFLILLGLIILKYTRPFISGFLGAATLYVMLAPQMDFLTQKWKFSRGLAASSLLIVALVCFLGPLTGLIFMIVDIVQSITIDPEAIRVQINDFIRMIEDRVGFNLVTAENLSFLPKMGGNILQSVGGGLYSFGINTVVILFVLYYMLYSKESLETAVREILPFKRENKQILAEETRQIIKANAIGIPVLGFIQGAFAYGGYLLFGVENALLMGILTGVSSIIPLLGTMVIWVPLALDLLLTGDYVNGIALVVYGLLVIGGVDNIARFMLQKQLADIHPLITVFGVLIGIPMFGFWGVIFGPLILSLFILFFNMYRHEFVPGSKASPRVTTQMKVTKIPSVGKKKKSKNKKSDSETESSESSNQEVDK